MSTVTQSTPAPSGTSGSSRIFNFSAGPATLPQEVLVKAQEDILDIFDTGIGVMEHSHRGKAFDRVIDEAIADCRAVGSISDDYEILFLQGGATMQFAMIPMAYLAPDQTADYIDTGQWARKAAEEAKRFGTVNIAFDGATTDYDHTPSGEELSLTKDAAYVHYTTNNTIFGTQFRQSPACDVPLVADASSDIFSRPWDIDRHALLYAGAQKNLGPSGVVLVIIRKDFLRRAKTDLPSMLNYQKLAEKGSRLNTPPTFGIYFMGQVFKWILRQGGLDAMSRHNEAKAKLIYDVIDASNGFYTGFARPNSRSLMNITFKCPTPVLDQQFLAEATDNDMANLKGYRTMGGMRASVYNAMPLAGCQALADFMADFASRNG